MSGFHPVASGSIPGSGFFLFACIAQWQSGALVMLRSGIQSSVQASFFVFFAFVAQLAERQLYTLEALGSIPDESLRMPD